MGTDKSMDENKNEFEVDVYTLQDEEGNEHEFEVIAQCEYKGATYYAMIPALDSDMEDEFCEYVILKQIVDENGDESLISIDDNEEEFNAEADVFDNLFDEEVDYDKK